MSSTPPARLARPPPQDPTLPNPVPYNLLDQLQRFHIDSGHSKQTDSTTRTQQEIEEIWELEPHLTVTLDEAVTGAYVQELLDTAMIFWFRDRPPPLDHFTSWAEEEFAYKRDWGLEQIKFAGRKFFIVKFCHRSHLDDALQSAPWFMGRRFMYTFAWTPAFDVQTEFLVEVPVWLELPFRDLILEPHRRKLVEALGPVLLYTQGAQGSKYPNDRACILWDTRKPTPKRLKIPFSTITLWQDLDFLTLPSTCSICRAKSHLAWECSKCPLPLEPLPIPTAHSVTPKTSRQLKFPSSTPLPSLRPVLSLRTHLTRQQNNALIWPLT
jgi:hypothetical protein